MDGILDGRILEALLGGIAPEFRGITQTAILMLAVVGIVYTTFKPSFEALGFLANQLVRSTRWVLGLFKPKPQQSPVPPTRIEIPLEKTIWEETIKAPSAFPRAVADGGIPIVTIANMKGGVGKTTLSANLAALYRQAKGKDVLLIDTDYQGSLSRMLMRESGYTDPNMTVQALIDGIGDVRDDLRYAHQLRDKGDGLFVFTADYPFATIENNQLAEWVSGKNDAILYRMCNFLKSEEVRDRFGLVVIDAPPRLTVGSFAALSSSTHLLVPTIPDEISVEASLYFLNQIQRMKTSLFPSLNVAGVILTRTTNLNGLRNEEQIAADRVKRYGIENLKRDDLVLGARVPTTTAISAAAGVGIAALRDARARRILQPVLEELLQRLR